MSPDLLPTSADQMAVPALVAITRPMNNTQQTEFAYFHCSIAVASMHRPDGKKLPFLQHILKTNIREDIAYLDNEISSGNQYIRRATAEEVQRAQIMEDPLGAVRKAVVKELTIEDLEKMLVERKMAVAAGSKNDDAAKIAGVDLNNLAKTALKAADVQRPGGGTVGGTNTASLSAASLLPSSMKKS